MCNWHLYLSIWPIQIPWIAKTKSLFVSGNLPFFFASSSCSIDHKNHALNFYFGILYHVCYIWMLNRSRGIDWLARKHRGEILLKRKWKTNVNESTVYLFLVHFPSWKCHNLRLDNIGSHISSGEEQNISLLQFPARRVHLNSLSKR